MPSLKTTVIPDSPVLEIERTSSTSGNAYITASIGKVISCSTSSEARPGASVLMATCTLVTSGNASKFKRGIVKKAEAVNAIKANITNNRFVTDQSIKRFNMC